MATSENTRAKIEIRDVSFDYVDRKSTFAALEHIDLSIREGEFLCVLGSSGCGKSTLLSLLNGLNRNGYPAGTYQVAFYVDGDLADMMEFEIK